MLFINFLVLLIILTIFKIQLVLLFVAYAHCN